MDVGNYWQLRRRGRVVWRVNIDGEAVFGDVEELGFSHVRWVAEIGRRGLRADRAREVLGVLDTRNGERRLWSAPTQLSCADTGQ